MTVYRIILTSVVAADNKEDALERQLLRGKFDRIEVEIIHKDEEAKKI